ncbi:MAG: MFS transporter [Spirochaetes bacterium]|nr:MFS transporter [Spirochaetota bacterium]
MRIKRDWRILLGRDLQIVFGITLISAIGVTSIAPAFPSMAKDLGLTEGEVVMLITVFTFPGIILAPVMGILADRFGRKKVIVPSLLLFGVAGGACAFATEYPVLLVLRFINGVGASALGGLGQTVITDMFAGKDRTEALGYNASVLGVGTMIYPALGGALALLGWNYPFLLSALALPMGIIVLYGLRNPEPAAMPPLRQYLGGALRSAADREVMPAYLATLATFILLYGALLAYFPFLMHQRFNASSSTIGLMLAATSVTTIIGAFNLGWISRRFRPKTIITVSFIAYAAAIMLVLLADNIWMMTIPVLLYGLANGLNIPSIQTHISGSAPMEFRGAFMSVNSMVLRLGQTVGPVLTGIAFQGWGMDGVFYCSAAFSIVAFVLLILFLNE